MMNVTPLIPEQPGLVNACMLKSLESGARTQGEVFLRVEFSAYN